MANDYTINVDVQVDESQLESLEKRLEKLDNGIEVNVKTNLSNMKDLAKNIKTAIEAAERSIATSQKKNKDSLIKNLFDPGSIDTKSIDSSLKNLTKIIGQNLDLGELKLSISPTTTTALEGLESKLRDIKTLAHNMGSIKLNISDNIGMKDGELVVGPSVKSASKTLTQDLRDLKHIVEAENSLNKQLKENTITAEQYKTLHTKLQTELADMQSRIRTSHGLAGDIKSDDLVRDIRKKGQAELEALQDVNKSHEKEYERYAQNIQRYRDNYAKAGNFGKPLNTPLVKGYEDRIKVYEDAVEEIKKADALIASFDPLTQQTEIRAAKAQKETYEKYAKEQARQLNNLEKFYVKNPTDYNKYQYVGIDLDTDSDKVHKSLSEMAKDLAKGSKYTEDYNAATGKMLATIDRGAGVIEKYNIQYDKTTGMTKSSLSKISQSVKPLTSYITELGAKFKTLSQYLISNFGFEVFQFAVTSGVTSIRELDSALTELKKTSDATSKQYSEFIKVANKDAKNIGSTTVQLTNSAADFSRLGYTLDESATLAKTTGILKNVSEFEDISLATEAMISMMKAFDVEAKNSMELVDKMNLVGNNYAISTDGIATALQSSASALVAAGNDFDKSVALVTAANAVVQDPNQVGAGMRTIALRLRGTSAETLEAAGEDTVGLIETTSKLEKQIKSLTSINGKMGVSILDINGNYRDTYDILLDISKIWDDLAKADLADGQNRQAALLEMMAGKNRSNILASILQNPELLESVYLDSSQNYMNSAQNELNTYLDSVDAKLVQLQESWSQLWQSEEAMSAMKGILDMADGVISLINSIGGDNVAYGVLGNLFFKFFNLDRTNYQLVL